ncbi:phosphoglucosamine mutase [Clostridium sp. CAG:273]|jgi:phosphoglucosamine mutase|nr:phosphoglucosamine mutase [Clostridia bacterium]CDE84074.1 phosphoglucosamine mutase [Clostridium sp. CAG:273]
MRKYFGTDGIRRIANTELTPELVYKVAKAGAYVLSKHANHAPTILIGMDTRISGTLIESAMTAGFLSYGANVKLLGVIPTPGVAYLTKKLKADASVVISASHNTYDFNGVKFFSNKGMKIPDELEEEIEEIMDSDKLSELTAVKDKIGVSEVRTDLLDEYLYFFRKNFEEDFENVDKSNFVVAIDTANGATSLIAEKVFTALGIKHYILNNTPNGTNINEHCGSTHLDVIKKYVVENHCNLGIAYDGDGDRCLAVDENGNEIDGDKILAIMSKYMMEKETLNKNTVVATVMSNLGLKKYSEENGVNLIQTKVGDRYVLEEMLKNGYNLGGEQSGHVIFLDYNPTGDGILTSLMLIKVMLEKQMKASELCEIINIYPQVLINAKVSNDKKYDYDKDAEIKEKIEVLNKEFAGNGRVLIRPSGTEPLVRVMIEGEDKNYITKKAQELADFIENKLK